jgi:hypothetical protein
MTSIYAAAVVRHVIRANKGSSTASKPVYVEPEPLFERDALACARHQPSPCRCRARVRPDSTPVLSGPIARTN